VSLGAFGHDFTSSIDNIEEAVHSVAKAILEHGVTAFCPTIVSSSPKVYKKVRKFVIM
jgi:N-acetylglucosamine-6-phosphate deacetylase